MGGLQQNVDARTAANLLSKKPEVTFGHDMDGNVMVNLLDVRSSDSVVQYVRVGPWQSIYSLRPKALRTLRPSVWPKGTFMQWLSGSDSCLLSIPVPSVPYWEMLVLWGRCEAQAPNPWWDDS